MSASEPGEYDAVEFLPESAEGAERAGGTEAGTRDASPADPDPDPDAELDHLDTGHHPISPRTRRVLVGLGVAALIAGGIGYAAQRSGPHHHAPQANRRSPASTSLTWRPITPVRHNEQVQVMIPDDCTESCVVSPMLPASVNVALSDDVPDSAVIDATTVVDAKTDRLRSREFTLDSDTLGTVDVDITRTHTINQASQTMAPVPGSGSAGGFATLRSGPFTVRVQASGTPQAGALLPVLTKLAADPRLLATA